MTPTVEGMLPSAISASEESPVRTSKRLLAILLFVFCRCAAAETIASNFPTPPQPGGFSLSATQWLAHSFQTDGQSYTLTSVEIVNAGSVNPVAGSFSYLAQIWTAGAGAPGALVGALSTPTWGEAAGQVLTLQPVGDLVLNASTAYWLVLQPTDATQFRAWNAVFRPIIDAGPGEILRGYVSSNAGSTWTATPRADDAFRMQVSGLSQPVPEASASTLLTLGLLVIAAALRLPRRGRAPSAPVAGLQA